MNNIDLNNKKNDSITSSTKKHANDDDLYAASLIDKVKEVKSSGTRLHFMVTTLVYLLIGMTILISNYGESISSLSTLFEVFKIQEVQIYTALFFMAIPIFWIYFSMAKKLREVTIISDGLLSTALRLTHPAKSSEKAVATISSAIKNEINQITTAINEAIRKSSDLERSVADEINQIESSMSSNEIKLMNMVDALKSQKEEIIVTSTATKSQVEELLEKFTNEASQLDHKIGLQAEKLSAIDQDLTKSLSIFDDTVEKIEQTSLSIRDNSDEISLSLNAANDTIADQEKSVKFTKDELELTMVSLNDLMNEQNLKLEKSMHELSQLSHGMDEKILNTDQLLVNFKKELEPRLSKIYEGLSSDIRSLAEISDVYESRISDISKTTVKIIDEKLAEEISINKRLSDHLKNLSSELGVELSNQITNIKDIFKNINAETKSAINDQKFEIEKSFDQKILEFNAKTKMMMESITDITNNTTNKLNITIKEILQTIKTNFEETSKTADHKLSNIQSNVQDQLIKMSVSLYEKSEELSQNTISNIEDIQDSISASIKSFRVEARNTASDIASEISSTTSKVSSDMVNVQKETLRRIDNEISQISISYNENLNNLIEATQKLSQNLDETRNSIKRDIFELPEETNLHLNKMRDMIEEQITAIGQLNSLISEYDIKKDIELAPQGSEKQQENKRTNNKPQTESKKNSTKDWILPEILSPRSRMNEKKNTADNQRLEILENEILATLKFDYEKLSTLLPNRQPNEFWESYYNGASNVISEKDYSRTGRKLFGLIKSKYNENKNFRSLVNKHLKSFEDILSNHQKINNEDEISKFLDSDSGILFILISHSIGKLD